ncbi:Uncharacterised protein [Yersinia aldovae]|uniref:Uncharacterized protein n=1 Tax=Yersinia aldovae TaxID=29483 RepID=A0A0T9UV06_YERAL|nr:Uncharacterised protein [Yersinia aldovae]
MQGTPTSHTILIQENGISNTSRHTPPDARHALAPHEHALIPNPTERSTTARPRSINKGIKTLCAQCYPRHACALCRSLFMHLHDPSRSAPELALTGEIGEGIDMRNHALYACMTQIAMRGHTCIILWGIYQCGFLPSAL